MCDAASRTARWAGGRIAGYTAGEKVEIARKHLAGVRNLERELPDAAQPYGFGGGRLVRD
jgi:hypothetical protein